MYASAGCSAAVLLPSDTGACSWHAAGSARPRRRLPLRRGAPSSSAASFLDAELSAASISSTPPSELYAAVRPRAADHPHRRLRHPSATVALPPHLLTELEEDMEFCLKPAMVAAPLSFPRRTPPPPARPELVPTAGRPGFFCDRRPLYADGIAVGVWRADGDGREASCGSHEAYADGMFATPTDLYADGDTPTAAVGNVYADGMRAYADGCRPSAFWAFPVVGPSCSHRTARQELDLTALDPFESRRGGIFSRIQMVREARSDGTWSSASSCITRASVWQKLDVGTMIRLSFGHQHS